jgi:hypothetical protein
MPIFDRRVSKSLQRYMSWLPFFHFFHFLRLMVQQLSLKLMRWIKLPTISPGVQNRRVQVDIQVTDKTNRSMSQPSESVALNTLINFADIAATSISPPPTPSVVTANHQPIQHSKLSLLADWNSIHGQNESFRSVSPMSESIIGGVKSSDGLNVLSRRQIMRSTTPGTAESGNKIKYSDGLRKKNSGRSCSGSTSAPLVPQALSIKIPSINRPIFCSSDNRHHDLSLFGAIGTGTNFSRTPMAATALLSLTSAEHSSMNKRKMSTNLKKRRQSTGSFSSTSSTAHSASTSKTKKRKTKNKSQRNVSSTSNSTIFVSTSAATATNNFATTTTAATTATVATAASVAESKSSHDELGSINNALTGYINSLQTKLDTVARRRGVYIPRITSSSSNSTSSSSDFVGESRASFPSPSTPLASPPSLSGNVLRSVVSSSSAFYSTSSTSPVTTMFSNGGSTLKKKMNKSKKTKKKNKTKKTKVSTQSPSTSLLQMNSMLHKATSLLAKTTNKKMPVKRVKWNKDEDIQLKSLVKSHGGRHWKAIALGMPSRSAAQCRQRWAGLCRPNKAKRAWTSSEDKQLCQYVAEYGMSFFFLFFFFHYIFI